MPGEIASTQSDEIRLRNLRAQMQNRHDLQMREMEEKNQSSVQRLVENHTTQTEQLRNAFDVTISREAEALEQRLHEVRLHNDERIETEKQTGDQQLFKVKQANQQRIAEYKKNSEAQIESLRKQLQASAETLREQAKKQEQRTDPKLNKRTT